MRPPIRKGLWDLPAIKGRCHRTCGLGDFRTARGLPANPPDHRCILMDQQHPEGACVFGGRCLRATAPAIPSEAAVLA